MRHIPKGREEEPVEQVGKKRKLETECLLLSQEGIVTMH